MLLRDTIFLVDASPASRATLRKTFENRYNILEAGNLPQADTLFKHNHAYIAAIILDMNLLTGYEIVDLQRMSENEAMSLVPLIAIVDSDDVQNEHRAFQFGFTDVIFRPFHSVAAEHRVSQLIDLFRNKWALEELVKEQSMTLRHTNEVMVDALSSIIECRSVESGQHILRIRRFTRILLDELARCCPEYGLNEQTIQSISSASSLHDIGKIAIPDAILNKPERLTAEEFEIMKTHTISGSDILERMGEIGNEDYLRYAYNICRYHHERWAGEGYPDGLSGDDIPICAQVVGLADAYDALTTDRVYKSAYPTSQAANMILNGECGEFSPKLLECFKHVRGDFAELAAAYADGQSPRSDAISAPLDPPARSAANTLQMLLTKHTALLNHMDATVMEIDLGEDVYHLVFNPDPDLNLFAGAPTLSEALSSWSGGMCHADGTSLTADYLRGELEAFSASGLRQRSYRNLLRGMDGLLHPYKITLLRLDTDNDSRKAMILWQKEDLEDEAGHTDSTLKRALTGLLSFSQSFVYDHWLTMHTVGSELTSLLGYSEEEIRTRFHSRLMELVMPDSRDTVREQLHRQLRHGNSCEVEFPLIRKDGQVLWAIGKGTLAAGEDGIERIYGFLVDVTQTRKAQEKLRLALDRQQLIMDQTSDIVFELDFETDRLTCSSKWEERFGYKPMSDNISTQLVSSSHFHPDDVGIFLEKIDQLKKGSSFAECTVRVCDSTGHYLWSRVRASLQRDARGLPAKAVGVFIDIDDELRASWALMASADRDSLTKLLNKEACRREVTAYLASSDGNSLSALAIIDLDNFKEVNDRYGHLFGDAILTRISNEISRMFRGTDVVGRIGGDEFLVFMSEIPNRKLAEERFRILIDTIRGMLKEHAGEVDLSCSVGIAFAPEHGAAYEELFQKADRALYQAKSMGKGRHCCYTPNNAPSAFPTMVSRHIDSDVQPDMASNNLIQFFFERLYESGDMEETIQSLLEIVGTQMDVSRVYIFENNSDNTACSNTFEWCNEGIPPEIHNLQNVSYITDIPNYQEVFNERGIFYCPDVTQLPQHLRDILEPQGIKSVLHCAIRDQGKFRGYVGFDENTVNRLWTQEQIDLLTFLSQVMSVFLLKQRVQDRTEVLVRDLRSVLDNQYSWTYVIDPDSYILQFINGKTLDLVPDAQVGARCHEVLMGLESPCESCPARLGSGGSCIIENRHLNLRVRSNADRIQWNGKPAWLITCLEMPQ